MQPATRLTVIPFLFAIVAVVGLGSAWAEDSSYTFTVETPPVALTPQTDETVAVAIEGFRTREQRVGYPDIPTRTFLIAIPPDATPRLTHRGTGSSRFEHVRPQPVERVATTVSLSSDPVGERRELTDRQVSLERVRLAAPEIYEAEGPYPSRVAWLGAIGVLRDQRYVEVHVAPVRYAGKERGIVIDSMLELTVHFDGAGDRRTTPREERAFESVYRNAFENYGQGRGFRLGIGAADARPRAEARQATSSSTTGRRRILVRKSGPVRLDHALFLAQAPEFLATDPAKWRLTNRGEQIPLHIQQGLGNPQLLEPGEWIQFYGQALDQGPDTLKVYDDPASELGDLYAVRDFSDENHYFLTIEVAAQTAMEQVNAAPDNVAPQASFTHTVHEEIDNVFIPMPEELWFSLPFTTESSPLRNETLELPGLASGTAAAQIRLQLRGFSTCDEVNPDHQSMVSLTNTSLQQLELPASNPDNVGDKNVGIYDGQTMFLHDFAWTHSGGDPQLTNPVTVKLEVANLNIPCPSIFGGNVLNEVILDWIEIDYARSFIADLDRITFEWPDGDAEFEITGFTGPAPVVYEITEVSPTGVITPRRLTNATVTPGGTTKIRFHMDNDGDLTDGTMRTFAVVGDTAIQQLAAADFKADRVSTIEDPSPSAEMVVIAHPDLLDSECSESGGPCSYDIECPASATDVCEITTGSSLRNLLDHRASQGISSRVVRVQDVEDEFNDGLAGPDGIKNFIEWLMNGGWGSPPTYVLLIGDGSFDYKAGKTKGNFVPTQIMIKRSDILGYYSSDNTLGAVVGGDYLTDVMLGRLSARTPVEAEGIIDKILDYEQIAPAGAWRSSALVVSDRGKNYNVTEANEFENINSSGFAYLAGTNYTKTHLRYWTDYCTPPNVCDKPGIKQDILDTVNGATGDGVALTQFMGHGNFDKWSDDGIICSTDNCGPDETALLTNAPKLPWLTVHTCLSGGFHTTGFKTFGEQWMKRLLGGSVAVFGPSGLGFRFLGASVIDVVWYDLFGPPKARILGTPVMDGLVQLCTQGSVEGCQFYTLMGDPATVLQLPSVDAVEITSADASTGLVPSVDLTWTASATAGATYSVYRADEFTPGGLDLDDFDKIADVATTSYLDEDVLVTKTYYYYVVAVSGGFESGWSNFNTTCLPPGDPGTPGPDCVQVRPLNLDPPIAPTGLEVVDTETGGTLEVSWDYNPEPDAPFNTVRFGTDSGMSQSISVAFVDHVTLSGLVDGTPYHVAVEARNTSGTTSALSPTVIVAPRLILGVHSPDFIGDLRIARSGVDALLSWGPVATDIYGDATTVDHYEVYRGTTPQFIPAVGNRIGQPVTPSFNDPGALAAGGPDYHYLVRAVDAEGNPGGLGVQLPRGIVDLLLDRAATPGNIVLSWPPVIDTLSGSPTVIDHYAIYADDAPFTREDIRDGNVGVIGPGVSGSSVEITPAASSRYYSVLAVDVRGNESPY